MPKKMMDIRDYCFEINSSPEDVLELLKAQNRIPEEKEISDLDISEKLVFKVGMQAIKNNYRAIWREILWKSFKYKAPNLVNAECTDALDGGSPIYVHATFMKCGKQNYVVKH